MRAQQVLQKCLGDTLATMHALRQRVLLMAVVALIAGCRLTLIDVARSWPGAERVRAPLKALDRLLSNPHLHRERERLYAGMARWLVRSAHPVIVIDWSDLKSDKSWHLLRAAVPVGGRTLPLLDMVFPGKLQGARRAERAFLKRLKAILPEGTRPILVTDAGFCSPWFRDVAKLGWDWIGRMRHRTVVKPVDVEDRDGEWVPCKALHVLAGSTPRDLGLMETVRTRPWVCRMVVYRKAPKGRKDRNRRQPYRVSRASRSRKAARRATDPWLIVASPKLTHLSARQLVNLYARRMQIESSFRDLKSHRYGQGFEDSLTRSGPRLEMLLLIHALATFASWLAGLACEAAGIAHWLSPARSKKRLYSTLRIGREALVRHWPIGHTAQWLDRLRSLPPQVLDQMGVSA